jgi:hypothetical protein
LIPLLVVGALRGSLTAAWPTRLVVNNGNAGSRPTTILICWGLHSIESESTASRNGAHFHAFQPLTSEFWNLTAVCSEFPTLPATIDGMEAMKLSLVEQMWTSSQIAAKSREIIDLDDDQTSAARQNVRVLHCDGSACSTPSRIGPTANRAFPTDRSATVGTFPIRAVAIRAGTIRAGAIGASAARAAATTRSGAWSGNLRANFQ